MKVVFFTYIAQYSIHLSFIIAINCTLLLTNIFDIIISSTLHFFLQEASVKVMSKSLIKKHHFSHETYSRVS